MVNVSPIELEVARNALSGVAEEMGLVLRRTSYSPNIKERADCSAAVFMPDGSMLAQAEHIPVHLGAMPASVAAVLERFDAEPGVQYAVNDPYAGGTHLNDLTIVRPVFVGGSLVAWVGNRAHHADVGGEAPGSMPAHATRVDQEGIRVAPMAAVRDGRWVDEFVEPFLRATRTPDERQGDLSAQLGANEVGARRIAEIVEREGRDRHSRVTHALLDYGERRMASALGNLPDGTYRFEDVMEWGDDDVMIRVAVTVSGDGLTADFSGTDPQVPANFNAVRAVTRSCLYYAVRVATDPTIPANGGSYRAVELRTEEGSLVDARPPTSCSARSPKPPPRGFRPPPRAR
jgi:N-methylhydantoinase B